LPGPWRPAAPAGGCSPWSGVADNRQDEVAPVGLKTHRAAGEADRPRSRRRALKRGNPIGRPARRPALASDQLPSAVIRSAIPAGVGFLGGAPHQGATLSLAWFHTRRSS
jgi:hypothetical protein